MRKKLPIGIQTFSKLISENYCYVDKTPLIHTLVESGKYYFLSRPRRFGKSLLVSTLTSLFQAEKTLFHGLAIADQWDWSCKYPVIHISFGAGVIESRAALDQRLCDMLAYHERIHDLPVFSKGIAGRFADVISGLRQKTNMPVVLLIDEYDKPILDNLVAGRDEEAIAVRDGLKGFYSVIKDSDPHLRFVLLTGVSKFSKVSLFSGLNNLEDITLSPTFASICGYTDAELRHTFAEWLGGVDMNEVRRWYNGYNFDGEAVYNPFDVLLYLKNRVFKSYWFETGNPSFLLRVLQERKISALDLGSLRAGAALLSSFDVKAIEPEALLFQTGYLTIKRRRDRGQMIAYELGFPNFEVQTSFHDSLLRWLNHNASAQEKNYNQLYDVLEAGNPETLRDIFHAFFASIPHDWYRNNQIANYEGYYCSIVYCYFVALGLDVIAEDATSKGRIDLTVKTGKRIFIIEFKVVEMAGDGSAMQQIMDKGYAQKYQGQGEIWLIGVSFNSAERNIVAFETRKIEEGS